jgi:hypothetical protein
MAGGTKNFYEGDFGSTLFPMQTNRLMIEHHEAELSEYVYQKILNGASKADNFLPQQRVYATKPRDHLRRTVKLDPIAEYFLYDVVYRNRAIFRGPVSTPREAFGYRFKEGNAVSVSAAYRAFTARVSDEKTKHAHHLSFDVASYFNSVYHHDISHWFKSHGAVTDVDGDALSQFFREIATGRSVDFLPQGIYPSKMIGSEFLKYIDLSGELKSSVILRLMDDFYLFDDSDEILKQDFIKIQKLLGLYSLNVNPMKTRIDANRQDVGAAVSALRRELLDTIEVEVDVVDIFGSGVQKDIVEIEVEKKLDEQQIATLLGLLKRDDLEEADADLILSLLKTHSDSLLTLIPSLLNRFPNITKHIYLVCSAVQDKEGLSAAVQAYLSDSKHFLEYQLFWLAVLAEEQLHGTSGYGQILMSIYERTAEYKIARAKVLEIPEQGYGFKSIRTEHLKTGASDWLAWASAMGTRNLKPAERNYTLDYFSKASPLNYLIASCVSKLP